MVMQFADDEEGLCLKWSTGGGRSGCRVRDGTGIAGSSMKEKSSAVRASVFDLLFSFFLIIVSPTLEDFGSLPVWGHRGVFSNLFDTCLLTGSLGFSGLLSETLKGGGPSPVGLLSKFQSSH